MVCREAAIALLVLLAAVGCSAEVERRHDGAAGGAGGAVADDPESSDEPATEDPVEGHDRCAEAAGIDLADGGELIQADTTSATDEHPDLECESPHVAPSLNQGQLYYAFDGEAGRTYRFELTTSFYGFLYVFPQSVGCGLQAIEDACSSSGATGMVSGIVNPGSTGESWFSPSESQRYVLGVDSDTSQGPFTLRIELD